MSVDLVIIAAYLVGTTLFGCSFYFRKGRDSSDEFTKGGGQLTISDRYATLLKEMTFVLWEKRGWKL